MAQSSYEVNTVYAPTEQLDDVPGAVRFVSQKFDEVALMPLSEIGSKAGLIVTSVERWLDLLDGRRVVEQEDPYAWVPREVPADLPLASQMRVRAFQEVLVDFASKDELLFNRIGLLRFLGRQSVRLAEESARRPDWPAPSRDTLKRWFFAWLRTGMKPCGVVEAVMREKSPVKQVTGQKRGKHPIGIPPESLLPAYQLQEVFENAYAKYIKKEKMSVDDAREAALTKLLKIPTEAAKQLYINKSIAKEHKFFSKWQFSEAMRKLRANDAASKGATEAARRGRATDGVIGPGFYEIDSTFLQVQLVSRVGGRKLISRPTLYLVVDIYSGVIVGYVLTLEQPSWATAMLALRSAFESKGQIFKRLGLEGRYSEEEWPCHHLPVMIRADRAEFLSHEGRRFPQSFIRVEITPPYQPKKKGTVEGKNSEVKRKARFLPGAYQKRLERGQPNGKKSAALDMTDLEKVLIELIMELNRRPIAKERIPNESISQGLNVGSRMDLWKWGLENRSGYTVKPDKNFLYEHLLVAKNARISSLGIHFERELYRCDKLVELGWLGNAPLKGRDISIRINPLYAGEVHFRGADGTWHAAFALDTTIIANRVSFTELRELREVKSSIHAQASTNAFIEKDKHAPDVDAVVKNAILRRKEVSRAGGTSKKDIRENKAADAKLDRGPLVPEQQEKAVEPNTPETPRPSLPKNDRPKSPRIALDMWDE